MENASKDYSCKNDECSMTFASEDLLLAHVKRHEMVLNLGSIKGNLFNDQTPTPTRFIRNCDEVGLFQDLQNVNPFDETFKRAVEQAKNGISSLTTPVSNIVLNDDTLHTPHIFPTFSSIGDSAFHINKEQTIQINTNDNEESNENENGSETPFKKHKVEEDSKCESENKDTASKIQVSNSLNQSESVSSNSINNINEYNESSLIIVNVQSDKDKNCTTNHTTSGSNENKILLPVFEQIAIHEKLTNHVIANSPIKLKQQNPETIANIKDHLKASLLRNSKTPITKSPYIPSAGTLHKVHKITPVIITNTIPIVTPVENNGLCIISPKILPEKSKIPQKEKNTTQRTEIKQKPQVMQCTNDEQREEFLARGRAAASRWRFKKKEQIKELITRNQQLENENSLLRSECAQLKKLLLTHKDCIIAQNSTIGHQVIVSSDVNIPKNIRYDNIKRKKKVPQDTTVINKSDGVR